MDRSTFNASNRSYMSPDMYPPGEGEVLTIRDVREVSKTARDSGKSWKALQVWWMEERPSLDLTGANVDWLVATFGPDDNDWIRKKVRVWHDPKLQRGLALDLDTPAAGEFDARRGRPRQRIDPIVKAQLKAPIPKGEDPNDDVPF